VVGTLATQTLCRSPVWDCEMFERTARQVAADLMADSFLKWTLADGRCAAAEFLPPA
jgi:hypothetical protein